eukprot:CAMPEP_0171584044 /NCGR_PEP_ID=MMETSP0961-20121227/11166_1 /TAXON_ID=87120 /ORGANISM="Aurantiochytrium limacinum, Strain ATCCMYA-1381" /LENGTH=420 /DNA_ID=CAMNT_0012141371 /DNA_START=278 /DNA_END=1537 /DNA_ORIENTATION=+
MPVANAALLALDASIRSGECRDVTALMKHEGYSVSIRQLALEGIVLRTFYETFDLLEGQDVFNGPEKSHADLALTLTDGHYIRVQLKHTQVQTNIQSSMTARYPGCLLLFAWISPHKIQFSIGVAGNTMHQAKRVMNRTMLDREVMRLVLAKEIEVITDVTDLFEVKSRADYIGHLGEIYVARFLRMAGLKVSFPYVNQLPYDLVVNDSITVQVKTTTFRPVSSHSMNMQTKAYAPEVCPKIFVFCLLVNDQPRSLYVIPGAICGSQRKCVNLPLAGVPSHLMARHARCLVEVHDVKVFDPEHLKALVLEQQTLPAHVETHIKLLRQPSFGIKKHVWPKNWSLLRQGACKALIENLKSWGCTSVLWGTTGPCDALEITLPDGEVRELGLLVKSDRSNASYPGLAYIEVEWDKTARRPSGG